MRAAVIFERITRRAILTIPRVRRFYAYTSQLADENSRLRDELSRYVASVDSDAMKLSKAEHDLEFVSRDRDDLELQLYALRSDFHRVVGQAEELRLRNIDLERTLEAQARQLEGGTYSAAAGRDMYEAE
jgi:hypothetical protein